MLEFLLGFLARSAVMVPTIMLVFWLLWLAKKTFQKPGSARPFNTFDIRTWPLPYVLVDAAIFALIFAAIATAFGDNQYAVALGAAAATMIALRVVPAIMPPPNGNHLGN